MYKVIVFLCSSVFVFFSAHSQSIDSNYVDGRIYVRTVQGATLDLNNYDSSNVSLNGILATYGVSQIDLPFGGLTNELDRTFEFTFSQWGAVDALIAELELLSDIEYAEKKVLHKVSLVPDDIHPSQWALTKVQAAEAWNITTGSNQVKIAVVDNAVSNQHEDLQANIWVNSGEIPNNGLDDDLNGFTDDYRGYDVSDNDGDPNPPAAAGSGSVFTHGTHCAGIASASTNNGTGIASLGFNTSIIPVKCAPNSSASEGAAIPNAYDGVYYAIQADADIISMSFGSSAPSLTGESLMSAANQVGIVLIAAAGNSATDAPHYPAAFQYVISVGATNSSDMITWFSNYGSTIDVMAPGANMYSTLSGNGDEYGTKSGTSMACPLVAGLAGLVLAQDPTRTPEEVELAIEAGCDPIDLLNPGYEGMMGAGRINAFKTLDATASIQTLEQTFFIFPNPANETIHIASDSKPENIQWISITGKAINANDVQEESTFYSVAAPQTSGIYFLQFSLDGSMYSERIIVQ
ncbi:MAG: hypothetical protein Crog4KO_07760 [Crocinitomicaceae bacterium]